MLKTYIIESQLEYEFMSKKNVGFSGIIGAVVILIAGYFIFTHRAEDTQNPFQFIPGDAIVIAETSNPKELIESLIYENSTWQAARNLEPLQPISEKVNTIDSLFQNSTGFAQVFRESLTLLSIHETGKHNFNYLLIAKLPIDVGNKKAVDDLINNYQLTQLRTRKYEGTEVYDIDLPENKYLSFCTKKGFILVSSSPVLIEDALRKKNSDDHFSKHRIFQKVRNTKGKHVEANIYVQAKSLDRILASQLQPAYSSILQLFNDQFAWCELDLKLIERGFILNGFTIGADSLNQYLSYYSKSSPGTIEGYKILPSSTSFFISKYIKDYSEYRTFANKWIAGKEGYSSYATLKNNTGASLGYNAVEEFSKVLDDEVTLAIVSPTTSSKNSTLLGIASTIGDTKTIELLDALTKVTAKSQNIREGKLKSTYTADENGKYYIYHLPANDVLYTLFGEFLRGIHNPYALVFNNYLVFADNIQSLKKLVQSNIRHNLIEAKPDFKHVSDYYPSKGNILFYTNLLENAPFTHHLFNEKLNEGLLDNRATVSSFASIGASYFSTNKMLNTNFYVTGTKAKQEESNVIWKTLLDTTAAFKPVPFTNHYTNNKDIFIQDDKNTIYLINETGRVLWKLPLSEHITSDVYEIDYYKNGKYQLLFSTKNYLHCFDRLGNYVEKFPIRLRSSSDNGMSLIKYSAKDDYRIFVPTNDQKVYAYNIAGQLLKGWTFNKTDHPIISKVEHIRIDNLDYILFADQKQVYILNRKGEPRVHPEKQFAMSGNMFYEFSGNSIATSGFLSTDTSGNVVKYYTSGKVETTSHISASPDHYFSYIDINDDGKNEYVIFDGVQLQIANNSTILINKSSQKKHMPEFAVFNFGHKNKQIGLVDNQSNNIVLIDINGKVKDGFPLDGTGLFTICKLKSNQNYFNVLVNQPDNFLVNYKLY